MHCSPGTICALCLRCMVADSLLPAGSLRLHVGLAAIRPTTGETCLTTFMPSGPCSWSGRSGCSWRDHGDWAVTASGSTPVALARSICSMSS